MGFAKLHQHPDQITTVQNTIKALNEPKNQSSCQNFFTSPKESSCKLQMGTTTTVSEQNQKL
jgi:hypothetical protein